MAPQRNFPHNEPLPEFALRQEFAITTLTTSLENLTNIVKRQDTEIDDLKKENQKLKDDSLVWKTKWAMLATIWTIILAIAMKFLPLHS